MQGIKFKSTKQQFDLKKSLSKLFDYKRDCFSRLRALKSICDAKDIKEVKETFINNYSVIYFVFHETFVILDSAKFNGHRKNATDDDRLLFFILEKILVLLPELLEKRWQMNSLIFVFRKCLHPSNLLSIRLEAMRLFLIYYQILGEANVRSNQQIEMLYASLIPGIVTEIGYSHQHVAEFPISNHQQKYYGIRPFPIESFILNLDQSLTSLNSTASTISSSSHANANHYPNYEYKNYTKHFFMQHLLDFSISQCNKIYWRDHRERRHLRGFEFLFSSFARIYLPYIFPTMATKNPIEKEWNEYTIRLLITIYNPPNDMPKLRKHREHYPNANEHVPFLQSVIIQWLAKYLLGKEASNGQSSTLTPYSTDANSLSKYSSSQSNLIQSTSYSTLLSSSMSLFQLSNQQTKSIACQISPTFEYESDIFRLLLNSKRFYVDLILNLFHHAFLWPFNEDLTNTLRDVIKVFRQWIYKETINPLPLFLAEPNSNNANAVNSALLNQVTLPNDNDNVCAGYMNMLNIFIMSSSNVFLLEIPSEFSSTLEKQVDVSKRVLNIYRFMVMKIDMERTVWENLVQVLIRVTECLISPQVPSKREDTLGGRLAPALFQTLVVTWIKANLNIMVSNQLWAQFHQLVSSLTNWEELINEWSNTMFILNRVMSRYVFHINLNELPMDRTIADRKRELRNKPKLHHIRPVSSNNNNNQINQNGKPQQSPMVNNASTNNNTVHQFNQHDQNHDQVSRTSSNPDSYRTDATKVQRMVSNESTSEMNGSITKNRISKIAMPQLHVISVNRHRDYHKNRLINRVLKRSLSDSCLVLTIQQSLCPIRTNSRAVRRRSYKASRHSRKSLHSHRNTPINRNLPMIDDEEMDDDENCTLAESIDYQHEMDGSHCDLSDNDDASLNELLMIDYLRRRTLFKMNSFNDVYVISNGRHGTHHHHGHCSNSAHVNGSDSIADTLSLGASAPECNSLKDTPLAFDSTSAASTCSSSITEQQMSIGSSEMGSVISKHTIDTNPMAARPVLLGGQLRGWNAEVAAILWRRMLEILGDINDIKDPKLHRLALDCLGKITEDFTKIRDNITYLNASSPDNTHLLVPSLHYYTSWLFRATTLPDEYKSGRLLAYKLLCTIAMYRSEQELSKEFLILFYIALKRAIVSYEMDLINTIIKYCGSKFFSAALWGSSCLLFHFVSAANVVIGSVEVKTYPRTESLQLLGSLIGFFDVFSNVLCLRNTETISLEPYTELKDHVIEILIGASKREQTGLGRVISFCSLGIFLYREFMKGSDFNRIKEIISILIAGTKLSVKRPKSATSPTATQSTSIQPNAAINNHNNSAAAADNSKFNNRVLCRVACDMLRLIADHAQYLMNKHPDFARRIIEGLCYTLELHIDIIKRQTLLKDFKNLLLCIMFCLSHWCMSVSKEFLLNTLVSEEYPGKISNCTNNSTLNPKPKTPEERPKNLKIPIRPCLLDLVISLYISVANIDQDELVKNESNSPMSEAMKASPQVGDMDTIDYTIWNSSTNSLNVNDGKSNLNQQSAHQPSTPQQSQRPSQMQQAKSASTVKKAAHLILLHFLNFMGHFPIPKLRTASLSALINENDDNPYIAVDKPADKIDCETLNAHNVLVFTVNNTCLISLVELPMQTFESTIGSKLSSTTSDTEWEAFKLPAKTIRIIIRNVLGKFAWDCVMLASPLVPDKNSLSRPISSLTHDSITTNTSADLDDDEDDEKTINSFKNSLIKDDLEILVNSIQETAPECRLKTNHNDYLQALNHLPEAVDTVALFINQHYQECQFNEDLHFPNRQNKASMEHQHQHQSSPDVEHSSESKSSSDNSTSTDLLDPTKAFQYCRQMVEQFGFLYWEKRKQIELLSKKESTVRELRYLDNQQCRDKHKIAVIYVGPGQETKESILLNKSGSRAFEEFVSRLGWEVNLATHAGFMGGLHSNLSTGLTAPYYADSFNEVIFHVSTRLEPAISNDHHQHNQHETQSSNSSQPIDKQQLITLKTRHLLNDEIHIVWSEHYKEYRRSILNTEFADALIVIYPLPASTYPNLYRIQLMRKPEVPFFGPLFHGAVVHRDELPGLVRATAINASRAKRLNMDNFKQYFEERYDSIANLATKYKEPSTFEEFANRIYAPRYDRLSADEVFCTSDPTKLAERGFITLKDFVQNIIPPFNVAPSSLPSTPHSFITEPTSPASSTLSASDISFSQQHQPQASSPSIITPDLVPKFVAGGESHHGHHHHLHQAVSPSSSSSSATSLRNLRPSSRSSVK